MTIEINPIPSGKLRIRKRPAEGILPDWLEIRHSKRGPYKKHLCVQSDIERDDSSSSIIIFHIRSVCIFISSSK